MPNKDGIIMLIPGQTIPEIPLESTHHGEYKTASKNRDLLIISTYVTQGPRLDRVDSSSEQFQDPSNDLGLRTG